jgi:hypothetical protein
MGGMSGGIATHLTLCTCVVCVEPLMLSTLNPVILGGRDMTSSADLVYEYVALKSHDFVWGKTQGVSVHCVDLLLDLYVVPCLRYHHSI